MKHAETIQIVAARTQVGETVCQHILKSYERYCSVNITQASRRNMEQITMFTAADTGIQADICEKVVTAFFEILSEEIKRKIPFLK